MTKPNKSHPARKAPGKRNARIAAVQVLYQMDIADRGAQGALDEFLQTPPEDIQEQQKELEMDQRWLMKIVHGVVDSQELIDDGLRKHISSEWRLSRMDPTLRALLRCASFEISKMDEVPTKVAIDEYLEVAKLFFGEKETGFVNAVLNQLLVKSGS